MKGTVFSIISTLIGAFIGAGFISGKEISAFFCSGGSLYLLSLVTFILFFIIIYELLTYGKSNTFLTYNIKYYKRASYSCQIIFGICSLLSASAMLAGIDALFIEHVGVNFNFPIFSLIAFTLGILVSFKGNNYIKNISTILVPIMVIGILIILFSKNQFIYTNGYRNASKFSGVLYVTMNIWFCTPLIFECGKTTTKKQNLIIALVTSLLVSLMVFFIAGAINFEGRDALNSSMPILYLLKNSQAKRIIFIIITLIAIFTTLCSSLYSFNNALIYGNNKKVKKILFCTLTFVLSLCSFNVIIERIYPLIGVVGLIYFTLSFLLKNAQRWYKRFKN